MIIQYRLTSINRIDEKAWKCFAKSDQKNIPTVSIAFQNRTINFHPKANGYRPLLPHDEASEHIRSVLTASAKLLSCSKYM